MNEQNYGDILDELDSIRERLGAESISDDEEESLKERKDRLYGKLREQFAEPVSYSLDEQMQDLQDLVSNAESLIDTNEKNRKSIYNNLVAIKTVRNNILREHDVDSDLINRSKTIQDDLQGELYRLQTLDSAF